MNNSSKKTDTALCTRCKSPRVFESRRRNPIEEILHACIGLVPCRCTRCTHRFVTFGAAAWFRAVVQSLA